MISRSQKRSDVEESDDSNLRRSARNTGLVLTAEDTGLSEAKETSMIRKRKAEYQTKHGYSKDKTITLKGRKRVRAITLPYHEMVYHLDLTRIMNSLLKYEQWDKLNLRKRYQKKERKNS